MNGRLKIMVRFFLGYGWALLAAAGTPALIPAPQSIRWAGGVADRSHYQICAPREAGLAAARGGEAPFVDEDYFYRDPLNVTLKQVWNKILVKAPRSAATGKWMFTCMPVAVGQGQVREVAGLRLVTNAE